MMVGRVAAVVAILSLTLVSAASAATVSIEVTPASPRVNDSVNVKTSGTVEDDGALWIYAEPNGADCAANRGDESARNSTDSIDLRFPGTGPFTFNSQTKFDQAVTYRICAYLYQLGDNDDTQPPRALATALVTVQPPPPPPDGDGDGVPDSLDTCPSQAANTSNGCPLAVLDADSDGVPDASDRCPAITARTASGCPQSLAPGVNVASSQALGSGMIALSVTCNQPCQLRASGKVGSLAFKSATASGGATPTTLTLALPKSSLRKLLKSLRKRKSATAKIVVAATVPEGTATTQRAVRLTRTLTPSGQSGGKGPAGDKGPTGDKGPAGSTGAPGAKGSPGDQGPTGSKGPTGDKGPSGGVGTTSVVVRWGTTVNIGAGGDAAAVAACNQGEVAIGGGGTVEGSQYSAVTFYASQATVNGQPLPVGTSGSAPNGWRVDAHNSSGSTQQLNVQVLCVPST